MPHSTEDYWDAAEPDPWADLIRDLQTAGQHQFAVRVRDLLADPDTDERPRGRHR